MADIRLGCCVKQHCGNVLGILFLHLLTVTSFCEKLGQNSSPKKQFHNTEPVLTQILSKSFIYDMDF